MQPARQGVLGRQMSQNKRAIFAIVMLFVLGIAAVWQLLQPVAISPQDKGNFRGTSIAELREVRLNDGSLMLLGARTRTMIDYTSKRRLVVVENGEAWFEIKPDTVRPFVVSAGVGNIVAAGTAFDVRVNNNRVTVTVGEGEVAVTGYASNQNLDPSMVQAGERIHYDEVGKLSTIRSLHMEHVAPWREGRRIYNETPLEEVVADLNRFSDRPIIISEKRLSDMPVTAEFQQFGDVDAVLATLDETLDLEVFELSHGYDLIYEAP